MNCKVSAVTDFVKNNKHTFVHKSQKQHYTRVMIWEWVVGGFTWTKNSCLFKNSCDMTCVCLRYKICLYCNCVHILFD